MIEQLMEKEVLYGTVLCEKGFSEEFVEFILREVSFVAVQKLSKKLNKYRKLGKLEDGMILTLKDKEYQLLYAARVFVETDSIGLRNFEIYWQEYRLK